MADVGPNDVGDPDPVTGAGGSRVTETVDVVVLGGGGGSDIDCDCGCVTVTGGGGWPVTVTVTGCAGGGDDGTDESAGRVGEFPATRSAATSRPTAKPASPVTTTEPQVGAVLDKPAPPSPSRRAGTRSSRVDLMRRYRLCKLSWFNSSL